MKNFVKFLALFAAIFALGSFGNPTAAFAAEPGGHSVCPGGIKPSDLATRVEQTASGKRLRGCYATAEVVVDMLKRSGAPATLTREGLPAYLRSLTPVRLQEGVLHASACLQTLPNGGIVLDPNPGCQERKMRPGELAWQDPTTGQVVYLDGCANGYYQKPLQELVVTATNCITVRAPVKKGEVVRGAYIARVTQAELPNKCHELRIPGRAPTNDPRGKECPDTYQREVVRSGKKVLMTVVCDWSLPIENIGRRHGAQYQINAVSWNFRAPQDGILEWDLPREALEGHPAICWDEETTASVERGTFVKGVATITEADKARAAAAY